jgi:molybdate transport system substrate-binding protein
VQPIRCLFFLLLLTFFSFGCRSSSDTNPATRPILVLVAASTRDAVQEIADAFTRETGTSVKLSPDDSSKLAAQIINGAPADLYLSANEQWATLVADKGFAHETVPLLGNALVLIVPQGNPAGVHKPEDLLRPELKKVAAAGPTVPAGIYAREALKHLKLWDELEKQKKIVSGENVRVTLAFVETGEVEAGVVYATDAKITGKVQSVFEFPASTHAPIVYPLVLLKTGAAHDAARRFYERLQSPEAAEVFRKFGFTRLARP